MSEVAEPLPVKRGPGRPRRVVAPKVESVPPPDDAWKTPEPPVPAEPVDPRIGQSCPPGWSSVGYGDDGSTYLCKNGKIVERVR